MKTVWRDTPRGVWLSLEEWNMPHYIMDYVEDQYVLVKNQKGWSCGEWFKVDIPWQPKEDFVWTFHTDEYCEDNIEEVTHFMLIPY